MAESIEDRVKKLLGHLGQPHITDGNLSPTELAQVEADVEVFNGFYPGGLARYVENARRLLFDAQHGRSYLTGCKVAPPKRLVHVPTPGSAEATQRFLDLEKRGLALMPRTGFVLVAGGLGERLGYRGIKLALPVDTATGTTYLEHYMRWILRLCPSAPRLVIMTSVDTHRGTVELLDRLGHCHWPEGSVTLLQQQSVFAFSDGSGALAIATGADGTRRLVTKPHGHGDVHALLYKAGIPGKWLSEGVESIVFMQDTNAAATITVPLSLAALDEAHAAMCFTTVPRLGSAEAVGALCDVTFPTGRTLIMNVEYNLFDSIYSAQHGHSEVVREGEFSEFPGSINTLILNLARYVAAMDQTGGAVPEFVNPKYAADGISFKSPARLESLMQDVAMALDLADEVVGIVFPRLFYAPVKNALSEAQKRVQIGLDPHSAGPGEAAVYSQNRVFLGAVGVSVAPSAAVERFEGVPCPLYPVIAVDGTFGMRLGSFKDRFPTPKAVKISPTSVLVLRGDVIVAALDLDGALEVDAGEGRLVVDGLRVSNQGWKALPSTPADEEFIRIRGFKFERLETERIATSDGAGPVTRVFTAADGRIVHERVVRSSL